MLSLVFLLFSNSFAKKICFTSQSFNYNCYDGESILNVNSSTDISAIIQDKIEKYDTEVTISLYSNFEYTFPLNIFNSKKVNILFSSPSSGKFDVSNIQNIDLNLQGDSYSTSKVQFQYEDSTLISPQSLFSLTNIELTSSITEIQLKSLSLSKSTFSFSKIVVNSLNYEITDKSIEVTNNNEDITIDGNNFVFTGDDQNLSIILSPRYDLVFNNQATTKSINHFYFNSIQTITFNGNDFLDSCYLSFKECSKIITNIDSLIISSFSLGSSFYPSNFEITALKSLLIKGELTLLSTSNLMLSTSNECSSRVSISIDSIKLNNGNVQFKSSWIDFTVDSFTFNSQNLPVYPCIGHGGSSMSTFNHITYSGSNSLSFNALNINLDVSGPQTDETLSTLMSHEWDTIIFKSFTSVTAVDKFDKITYSPNDINGFMDEPSILSAKSKISNDFIVTLIVSSYTTVPLLLCYSSSSSCSYGTAINDLSQLSKMIPPAQKMINLTITKSGAEIDLSDIKTVGSIFTISSSYSSYYITSLKMSDPSDNANIEHLILKSTSFYTGDFQINAKEIDISSLSLYSSSKPSITINEHSKLNIDVNSLKSIAPYIEESFPVTIVNGISSNYYTSLEITDSEYILKGTYYTDIKYPKEKFSDIVYQIQVSSTYTFPIITSTSSIGSLTVQFIPSSMYSSSINIQVNFNNLSNLVTADKICIDFGVFNNKIIDLNNFPMKSYFDFIGNNVQILNQGISSDNSICTCKELPCNECPEDLVPISYNELNQKIQEISGDSIQITVIGSNDGSSPILSLSLLDNKDATIIGSGTDPKIQISCSTPFKNETKTIEFTKITIIPYTSGNDNSLEISNLKLYSDCIVDSSFNEISLTVGLLDCYDTHLVFKSVLIQQSLDLNGDPTNSQSSTKISFENPAEFKLVLPSTITISGSHLMFSNLQFDLSYVIPSFTIADDVSEFNIIGVNGDIEKIGSNIIIPSTNSLKSVHIFGTWANEKPSKFFVFNNFQSDLHLQSENSPISVHFDDSKNIIIEKEAVGISGNLTFAGGSNYKISSTIIEKCTFHIHEINALNSINLQFTLPTIGTVIDEISSESKTIKFYLKIGLDDKNKVDIIEKIDDAQIDYEVDCIVSGSLNDEKIKKFIENNHTLIVVNNENTIKTPTDRNLKFTKTPQGFNNNNFKLNVQQNELVLYTFQSPYESEINLYYGYCFQCSGTEITNDDFAHIENYIPSDNTSLSITFAKSAPENTILDFAKENIKNLNLKLIKSSYFSSPSLSIQIKFGSSVSSLIVDGASLEVSENDDFIIQSAEFKEAKFTQPANYNHINSLTVALNTLFTLGISEFNNELNIIFDSSSYSINYTKIGVKIVPDPYSSFSPFDIDVSKMTNVNIIIRGSPKINLDLDVTELKQINSLIFDFNTINIGANWNQSLGSSKVKYTLMKPINEITVVTCSFPFESWDLMYDSEVAFDSSLSPYNFSYDLNLNNRNMTLKTSVGSYSSYTITLGKVYMTGNSAISCVKSANGKLILDTVTIKGNSNITNAIILNELTLEAGSSINGDFIINDSLILNIEWNLNEMSLFNPSSLQNAIPQSINIIYKGLSISGKEKEFDEFLSNGIDIIRNVDPEIINYVHFISISEKLFNESENLSIKCQFIKDNEIQLISTKPLYYKDDQSETNIEEQTNSDIGSDVEEQSNSIEEQPSSGEYVPIHIENGPSIDDSFLSHGNNVLFTEDGYYDDNEFFSTKGNTNDILLIKTDKKELILTPNIDGKPNSILFISPKNNNAIITISSPNQDEEYGSGQVGVHINSNNPSINLPQSTVPLNIFNDENSSSNFVLLNSEDSKLLEDKQISLGNLIISRGLLQMNLPKDVTNIKFDNIEIYLNSSFNASSNNEKVEISVGTMKTNPFSSIISSNVIFNKKIKVLRNSRIEIKEKVKFNEKTKIEISDSSFIELGQSEIEGICKEIKVNKEKSINSLDDSEEISAKLICGNNFDCAEWKEKYIKDDLYKYAKCMQENDEVCLVVSNKDGEKVAKKKKNSLSGGAIAGIIIAVVAVLIAIIVMVVMLQKNSQNNKRSIYYIENDSRDEELAAYLN